MSNYIKTIFFDLDGTLIQSEHTFHLTMKECLESFELHMKPEDHKFMTGQSWKNAIDHFMKSYPIPIPQKEFEQKAWQYYQNYFEQGIEPVPGASEAVQALSKIYPLGLVSASGRRQITAALKQLQIESCFQLIVGAEDVIQSKPAPEAYLKAAQFFKTPPAHCLTFEDSFVGISAAHSAGIKIVAIECTNLSSQDQSKANHKVKDLREVNPNWIQSLKFQE